MPGKRFPGFCFGGPVAQTRAQDRAWRLPSGQDPPLRPPATGWPGGVVPRNSLRPGILTRALSEVTLFCNRTKFPVPDPGPDPHPLPLCGGSNESDSYAGYPAAGPSMVRPGNGPAAGGCSNGGRADSQYPDRVGQRGLPAPGGWSRLHDQGDELGLN